VRLGRLGILAGGSLLLMGLAVVLGRNLFVSTPDYPLATKGPPEGRNVQASFVELSLADLLSRAHSVVWVDVLDVEERWRWQGVEWSQYRAAVREYIVNRTDSTAETLSVVQAGGGEEIYYNFHHLQPGRGYVLVLESVRKMVAPAAVSLLVSTLWSLTMWLRLGGLPPWANARSSFTDMDELVRQIVALTGV